MKFEATKNSIEVEKEKLSNRFSYRSIVLALIISVIPLLIYSHQYKTGLESHSWFHGSEEAVDFFLYYKQCLVHSFELFMV